MKMIQKIIWKNFLITGSLLFLISCSYLANVSYIKTVSYEYQNETGIDLIMEVYNRNNDILGSYNIPNGEKIITNTTKHEVPSLFDYGSSLNKTGRFIVLKFNNGKCFYYDGINGDENDNRIFFIKRYDNYSKELTKNSKYTLIYKIKEKEYQKSVKCK